MKRKIKKEISMQEYEKFIDNILNINSKNGELPEYITCGDTKIYKTEYIETIESVNKFVLENGRYPQKVTFYLQKHNR